MRYKYYVKKNEKKLMYFCITGRLELWISRIICICCNVPNIPSLPAVSNSFFLPTSTTPYFRSALSRTIIIQFHTDIHLLYVVAQIWKTASSFFLRYDFFFALLLFLIFFTFPPLTGSSHQWMPGVDGRVGGGHFTVLSPDQHIPLSRMS